MNYQRLAFEGPKPFLPEATEKRLERNQGRVSPSKEDENINIQRCQRLPVEAGSRGSPDCIITENPLRS